MERLQDCLDVQEWVFETAKEKEIKELIFCGDLFHERQTIDVYTYQKTFNLFEKYLAEDPPFNVRLLLGNHDLWHLERWDVSSVSPLRALDAVTVIDKPGMYEFIPDVPMAFLPYTHDPIKDLKSIEKEVNWRKRYKKLLFGHVAIDGALWNVKYGTKAEVSIEHDGDMTIVGPDIFDRWDQVFLGHYHAQQILGNNGNVEYVGSPLELNFGEAFQQKHVIIYDTQTNSKEYIRNEFSPKHYIIPESDLDKYDLENNFVRLVVEDIAESNIIEMRNKLIQEHKVGSLVIKQEKRVEEENNQAVLDAKSILFEEDKMLEKYVDETDTEDLDRDKLLEIAKTEILEFNEQ
jgi:DNA repair exonuclease SbcCD nuclease subunit